MKHIFEKGKNRNRTLLLLHGTGGDENDLIPLAKHIDDDANLLSVRGNVLENGMPRFFKRLAEGVFDEEDLIFRTGELNDFLNEAAEKYSFDRSDVVAVGYSNGANIAGSLLFHYENSLKAAILHHPMVPRRNIEIPSLAGTPVFIGAGMNDPICLPQETRDLAELLKAANGEVAIHWENHGHQLTSSEVEAASAWYKEYVK
ncbi:alpha/beta hydrolase [Metabacillus idriensis]|uniref:alpha/beta hydrolase n=1 Tax=Metabacillus idriensis TaxID=324768 RepID=UPI00163A4A1D|nr:alpha/beta hydrolase [Metabacillus idriensis]QNG58347.1 alpha/beta hydrolase [Bacillus sp. PAMC26568]